MISDRTFGTFTHFQSANANTTYIIGEFPWQVRRDDKARTKDYIDPPFMLSGETTDQETTWSIGEYTSGKDIWQAFKLPGNPPSPRGIFANQPSPFAEKPKHFWNNAALLLSLALLVLMISFTISSNKEVFSGTYDYSQRPGQEASFVTPVFEVGGHASNVELKINTDLSNNWGVFQFRIDQRADRGSLRLWARSQLLHRF